MDTRPLVRWVREGRSPVARNVRRAGVSALGIYAVYAAHGATHPTLLRPTAHGGKPLPGDVLVPGATSIKDFTMRIHAPACDLFPWLLQLGFGRAGWYSWYPLDNGGAESARCIVPDLQYVAVGDFLPDGPRAAQGFGQWWIRQLERDRCLVLYSRREPFTGRELGPTDRGGAFECSWAFVLEPAGVGATTVLMRIRSRVVGLSPARRLAARLIAPLFDVGDTVMQWTLLDGLRERAEAAPPDPVAPPPLREELEDADEAH